MGGDIDQRADLYSLGVMIYEMLTGRLPFESDNAVEVITQHLHAPVVSPRAKKDSIPAYLDRVVVNLLSKDPELRPLSTSEVLQFLEEPGVEGEVPAEDFSLLERMVRGRMVGREEEMGEARGLWNKARGGEGQVLLISGEPGIGKTRFTREVITQAEVSGGQSFTGECHPEGSAPYAAFAQLVRRILREHASNGLELPDIVTSDLLELAPGLRPEFPDIKQNPKLDPEAKQLRLFESFVKLCGALTEKSPLLLVVEDIHWADSGSLGMLQHLARRTREMPVMFLGTYREVELDEALPFHEALLELNRQRIGTRIKLERLDREKVREMLVVIFVEEITDELLEGIFRETEGNPFFTEEVCKALVDSGEVWYEDGEWHRPDDLSEMAIPQSVRVAVQSRVSKLTEETQEVLLNAAVIGREFDYQVLWKVAGKDEDALIDGLEEAMGAQLVEEVKGEGGEVLSFSHALIPASLREGVSGLRRSRLHRKVAAAIEEVHPEEYELAGASLGRGRRQGTCFEILHPGG